MSNTREMTIWLDADGQAHRDYGLPAITTPDGFRAWYLHGKLHRPDGLPAVLNPTGEPSWVSTLKTDGSGQTEGLYFTDTEQYWLHGHRLAAKPGDTPVK